MDFIRDLLLWMEAQSEGLFVYDMLPDGKSVRAMEHVQVLISGGFLEKYPSGAFRMTWEGHEFLDKVRDPEIWLKTKDGANKLGSWSLKLLGDLATGFIKLKAQDLDLPI